MVSLFLNMPNITYFLLLEYEQLLLFFVLHDFKLNIFGYLWVRQNKTFEDITMGFRKLWWTFFWHFKDQTIEIKI